MDANRDRPRVVIVGGGFAGIQAAKALKDKPVDVALIDRRNHHLFQPLLYQVATAALGPSDVSHPIRRIFRHYKNAEVIKGEVVKVDPVRQILEMAEGQEEPYDYLILASGSKFVYFGHDEWSEVAPGLKSIEDALTIRRRMLSAYEQAEYEQDEDERDALMTFVIVGGGPTGVEMAGTMRDVASRTIAKDFRHINPKRTRIILVDGGERLLSAFHPKNSEDARRQLEGLGVEIHLGVRANEVTEKGVRIGDDWIEARTVVWAAGVVASDLSKTLEVPKARGGRIAVEKDLTVPGYDNVYAVGDTMSLTDAEGTDVPGLAPAAMQAGRHAAKNVLRTIKGEDRKPFVYNDKGSMATIGRNKAVADVGGLRFSGFPAWFAWMIVHVFFLVDFRNKVATLVEWAWSYVTYDRGARLITGETDDPILKNRRNMRRAELQAAHRAVSEDTSHREPERREQAHDEPVEAAPAGR